MTYAQFSDLVFGPLPKTESQPSFPTVIGYFPDQAASFTPFMDDHLCSSAGFDAMYNFLKDEYFPRVRFGPVYLQPRKTVAFVESMELIGFRAMKDGVRPADKHRKTVKEWPVPRTKAEVEGFLWITPFLRTFIAGRSDHARIIKQSYQESVPLAEGSIQTKVVDKQDFTWGPEQQRSFDHIKMCIEDHVMRGADPNRQYHLATDASGESVGACLFQLEEGEPGTEATNKHKTKLRIIQFLSFKLADAETRYMTTERECLAVVRALAEVRWLVMGSEWPVKVYTDHSALPPILNQGTDVHHRIARWIERLGEYDIEVHHRPCSDNTMRIADGLSRMPGIYVDQHVREDTEKMAIMAMAQVSRKGCCERHPMTPRTCRIIVAAAAVGAGRVPKEPLSGDQHLMGPNGRTSKAAVAENDTMFGGNAEAAVGEHLHSPTSDMLTHTDVLAVNAAGPSLQAISDVSQFEAFLNSSWYSDITHFLLFGLDGIKDLTRNSRRNVLRSAKHFRLSGRALLRMETSGVYAKCILPHEVDEMLYWAHELHGHFANAITLHHLVGQFWWPKRVADVERYCRTCDTCQYDGPKKPSADMRPIVTFGPMSLVAMDFLGPITPMDTLTGNKYVLVFVDYFTRFVWLYACPHADCATVVAGYRSSVQAAFGMPEATYSDNGSHFTGRETRDYFEAKGTKMFFGPISHPASTGLVERAVQMTASQIRKYVIERPSLKFNWSTAIPDVTININSRLVKLHNFTPSELMLGFKASRNIIDPTKSSYIQSLHDLARLDPEQLYQRAEALDFRIQKRDEERREAVSALVKVSERMEKQAIARWTQPKVGDLVMIRDIELEKQHGRKFDRKWSTPRMVMEIKPSGVTAMVQDIYHQEKVKPYHLNHLKVYHPRRVNEYAKATVTVPAAGLLPGCRVDRTAMSESISTRGVIGSRSLNLFHHI